MSPRRVLLAAPLVLLLAACGGGGGSDRFEAAAREAEASTVPPSDPTTTLGSGEPSDEPSATTTTAPVRTPEQSLLAAVDAYTAELGPAIRALEMTTHFPVGDTAYASLQYQVPENPQNVDQRDWRDGKVGEAQPVQITASPDATLEENLFSMTEINWPAVAAQLAGAPALVEQKLGTTFEDSDGVTHIIATKDLPFSANTVVRVYVDGGARTSGGYVEYLADGSVAEVQA